VADRDRVAAALRQIKDHPYTGDIAHLQGERFGWCRRVGSYRIIYGVLPDQCFIIV
jgi:mRNA-degrading endonuclease RelE of RelBE toxin-antitoxin system